MKKKITFCFDIDNVICKTTSSNYSLSKPIKKNIDIINKLKKNGHTIKIFTARYMGRNNDNQKKAVSGAKKFTISQLKKWKLNYDQIFFGKPSSDFYIDDKNLNFNNNWNKNLRKYTK